MHPLDYQTASIVQFFTTEVFSAQMTKKTSVRSRRAVVENGLDIQRLRIKKCWSQKQLAKKLNVKLALIQEIESGQREALGKLRLQLVKILE